MPMKDVGFVPRACPDPFALHPLVLPCLSHSPPTAALPRSYRPVPASDDETARSIRRKSSQTDQSHMYIRSYRSFTTGRVSYTDDTCARPAIPKIGRAHV